MKERVREWFKRHFDYDIIGEYYDTAGDGVYRKKYNKRYYLKCLRNRHKKSK